jgi:alanine-glyoxylate transaminase / serine-glyoxylate transaminase / serine-pyruvate transaminase
MEDYNMQPTSSLPLDNRWQAPARLLLGPGPSQCDPRVLRVMATPLLGHLDPAYLQLMDCIQDLLRDTFRTQNPLTLAVPGTGSAAMETAIANLVEPGMAVLVCCNGFFSLRQAEMARRHGGLVEELHKSWGEAFDADEVDAALAARPAKVVCIVQAETSTGVLQPVAEIADTVHRHGGVLVVDAVTSLGGVGLETDAWDLDVVYSCSQKCLGCPPGLGPITFGPRAVEIVRQRKEKVANWYLDLSLLQKYWGSERAYHHTAPISMSYALYEGLQIIAEEGLEKRWERHERNARLLWDGLGELGLECFIPAGRRLVSLTTVQVPDGVNDATVRRSLLEMYGIEIGGGLGELKGKVWRVGLMGYSSQPENVLLLLDALRRIL